MSKKRTKIVTKAECGDCPSLCCHGFVMPIDRPRTKSEVEELKWHIQYDTVSCFIRNTRWHVLVEGKCQYLGKENLCVCYSTRPDRCRQHNPPDCERYGSFFDVMLQTPEELDAHLGKERARARRRRARRRRAAGDAG
ncbi:MAG: YkgJ family cysteine cluster protein [Candidatus Brocadiia bacterium]|nr:YkgJ family cysteine cluster protein [Candidatus Brocadiia bacterium]